MNDIIKQDMRDTVPAVDILQEGLDATPMECPDLDKAQAIADIKSKHISKQQNPCGTRHSPAI
jgi:hypothetical protein